jgi:hypothetical protein
MAMRVLYLDVDDEITSAASRIRSAEEIRVAIVLPYGSRVATSRINFRLLARDATVNGKRLAIVAGDAATRALAASAGLPIYANVAEYEAALEAEKAGKAENNGGPAVVAPAAGSSIAAEAAEATPSTDAAESAPTRRPRGGSRRTTPKEAVADDTATSTAVASAAAMAAEQTDMGLAPPSSPSRTSIRDSGRSSRGAAASDISALAAAEAGVVPPDVAERSASRAAEPFATETPRPATRAPSAIPAARVMADTPSRSLSLDRSFGTLATRMPIVIGAAVLALALIVGGVGAYLLLPTATIVITPKQTSIGPVELRITASPSATEPDQAAKVVPAASVDVDVDSSQTFAVTGKRVEEKRAHGRVRFRNKDFTSSNTIPKGSVVSTQSGIRFATAKNITIKRADLVGLTIIPSSASVDVTAIDPGPEGNVEPNTILVIPRGEDPQTLDVTNPDATSGGKRDEFKRVSQADVDKAMAALRADLTAKFQERVADPALAGEGTTVFPETAALGEPTFSVDPATLVGDEVDSFDLGATATGTVLAVDETAVTTVASADIATHVEPGYSLVDGSSQVEASPGVVESGVITFPVTITARQVRQLDPQAIEAEIRGKPLAEAESILQGYGTSELSVWPDWVGSIPTLDARVDVQVAAPGDTP